MPYPVNQAPVLSFLSDYGYETITYRQKNLLGDYTVFVVHTAVGTLNLSVFDRMTESERDFHPIAASFTRMSKTVTREISPRQFGAKGGYQQVIAALDSILLDCQDGKPI